MSQKACTNAKELTVGHGERESGLLHLNLGHSYEMLGSLAEARIHYQMAASRLDDVPEGAYKDMTRNGIARGFKRTDPDEGGPEGA